MASTSQRTTVITIPWWAFQELDSDSEEESEDIYDAYCDYPLTNQEYINKKLKYNNDFTNPKFDFNVKHKYTIGKKIRKFKHKYSNEHINYYRVPLYFQGNSNLKLPFHLFQQQLTSFIHAEDYYNLSLINKGTCIAI